MRLETESNQQTFQEGVVGGSVPAISIGDAATGRLSPRSSSKVRRLEGAAEATLGGIAAGTVSASGCAGGTTGTTGGAEDACSRNGNPGGGMTSEGTAGAGTALGARCFA